MRHQPGDNLRSLPVRGPDPSPNTLIAQIARFAVSLAAIDAGHGATSPGQPAARISCLEELHGHAGGSLKTAQAVRENNVERFPSTKRDASTPRPKKE